ncbi:endonuclease/exonuclease/phosphatase family protein [Salisaeta longa]|uniref:endonuclease/exonuclease/phosphatase family protein n=1 Tax=Salisaeta longa TaxID=503170 RepID=UPI0003B40521|nr:endonuclease/exonuclease/phosphatase family protein [Salisaeta longa]
MRTTFRLLLRFLLAVLVLLFGLGYACRHLPPEWFWWTGPVAVFLPLLALLLLPAIAWYLPRAAWQGAAPTALGWGVLLVLIGVRFGPNWTVPYQPASAKAPALRVMSYNAPVHGPHPDSLAQRTVALVQQAQPDLLGLQEPWLRLTKRRTVAGAPHLQALLRRTDLRPTPALRPRERIRQPVLARIPLTAYKTYILGTDSLFAETVATRTTVRWQGRRLAVYNVHLNTVSPSKPWRAALTRMLNGTFWWEAIETYRQAMLRRAREARVLRDLIAHEPLPVIVLGDFNSTRHHWAYHHVAEGLRDAYTIAGRGWGGTYPATWPLVRIDHILVSKALRVQGARVLPTYGYSDHRPVVAELVWHK